MYIYFKRQLISIPNQTGVDQEVLGGLHLHVPSGSFPAGDWPQLTGSEAKRDCTSGQGTGRKIRDQGAVYPDVQLRSGPE